ncbi:MAG TPA: hypothetical protein VIF59_03770 [Methylomirabilota bacterium]|jgi:hypothetical protein
MRIETMRADVAVHVGREDETVELTIGDVGAGSKATTLSIFSAEMVLHALGLTIAQIRDQRRRVVEEQHRLARVVAETEVHRR